MWVLKALKRGGSILEASTRGGQLAWSWGAFPNPGAGARAPGAWFWDMGAGGWMEKDALPPLGRGGT